MMERLPKGEVKKWAAVRWKLDRILRLVEQVTVRQYDLAHQEDTLASCQNVLEQNFVDLSACLDKEVTVASVAEWRKEVNSQRKEMQDSLNVIRDRTIFLIASRRQTINLQHTLHTQWNRFAETLAALGVAPLQPIDLRDDEPELLLSEVSSILEQSSPEQKLHPLAAQYYDQIGHINMLHEQLRDLDESRYEDAIERDFRRDKEETLSTTSSQLNDEYISGKKILQAELAVTAMTAEALRVQCEAEGVSIESAYSERLVTSSGHQGTGSSLFYKEDGRIFGSSDNISGQQPSSHTDYADHVIPNLGSPARSIAEEDIQYKYNYCSKVDQWIEDLDPEVGSISAFQLEHERSSSASQIGDEASEAGLRDTSLSSYDQIGEAIVQKIIPFFNTVFSSPAATSQAPVEQTADRILVNEGPFERRKIGDSGDGKSRPRARSQYLYSPDRDWEIRGSFESHSLERTKEFLRSDEILHRRPHSR